MDEISGSRHGRRRGLPQHEPLAIEQFEAVEA